MDTQYTFGTSANAYFQGHDLRVRWDDRSLGVIINEKDGLLAIDVKDHDTIHQYPLASQAAAKKIGDAETQRIYEQVQHDFWHWAEQLAKDHGFETIYQAGRSGGWLAVAGTENIPGSELIDPGEEDVDLRDRFLAFAFEIEQGIEGAGGYKQQFYAALLEAGEEHREPVECPNCGNKIDPRTPLDGHTDRCFLNVLLDVLVNREHIPSDFDLTKIDADRLWDQFGGPAADWVAEQMGIPTYGSLADEFEENGLSDAAAHLRSHGRSATLAWIDGAIREAKENDDPEGWRFGNLEVAKQKLEDTQSYAPRSEDTPSSPNGMAGDPEPEPFGEVKIEEFTGDADGNFHDDVMRLDRIEHGREFEDRSGRFFTCVGYGPVQGSVEVEDDEGTHAYYDCDTKVRLRSDK